MVNEKIILVSKRTISLLLIISIFQIFSCATNNTRLNKDEKARLLKNMGNSLFYAGKPRDALPYLLKAEKIDPLNPDIQRELALVYREIKQYDLAFVHFKEAIKLKPDFSEAYNDMGVLYSLQGKVDEALECFNKAVKNILYRTPHFAYHNMGLVYFKMKDYSRAIEFYKKALSVSPGYVEAYFGIAEIYELLGENEKAILTYDQIKKQAPESLVPYLAQAELYRKTGQIDKSIDNLNYIIGIDPRSQVAREAIKLLEEIQSSR